MKLELTEKQIEFMVKRSVYWAEKNITEPQDIYLDLMMQIAASEDPEIKYDFRQYLTYKGFLVELETLLDSALKFMDSCENNQTVQ